MHSFVAVVTILALAVSGTGQQEEPLEVAPVEPAGPLGNHRFEFSFHPHGWSEPQSVSLESDRNRNGAVTGFALSSGTERGIAFMRDGR